MKVEIIDVCAARGHLMLVIDISSKKLFKTVKERISVVCDTNGGNIIRLDNYLQETRPVIKQIVKNYAHVYSITTDTVSEKTDVAGVSLTGQAAMNMKSAMSLLGAGPLTGMSSNKTMLGTLGYDMHKEYQKMMKSSREAFDALQRKPMSIEEQKAYVGLGGDIVEPGK